MKKKDDWHRPRHTFGQWFMGRIVAPLVCHKGFVKNKIELPKGPLLVLCNHVTNIDPQLIYRSVKNVPIYFVAMSEITSRKGIGSLIQYFSGNIPILKGVSDPLAVRRMIKVKNEGYPVILFPEGNRTFDGSRCNIDKSTAKLVKIFKTPVAFLNIEGGYGFDPRWGNSKRRGYHKVVLRHIMSLDEINSMSLDEIYDKICEYLTVEDVNKGYIYKSNKRAESLERLVFTCPDCGAVQTIQSKGNEVYCTKCGYKVEYGENLHFTLVKGNTKIDTVKDWCLIDKKWLVSKDLKKDEIIFRDEHVNLVRLYYERERRPLISDFTITAYNDRFEIEKAGVKKSFPLDRLTNAQGIIANKALFYVDRHMYQITGESNLNAMKYVMLIHHNVNLKNGIQGEDEFLGI